MPPGRPYAPRMARRPLFSRFNRLPTYVWRAMKEAHALIYAGIATVSWTAINYAWPWIAEKCGSHVTGLGTPVILSIAVLIALTVLGLGGYLVWEDEEHSHQLLQASIAPRLTLRFDPNNPGCLYVAEGGTGWRALFIRLLPIPQTTLHACKGYLESIERLENSSWVSEGFATRPQLHWADLHEQGIVEADIFSNNSSQFLDLGFLPHTDNSLRLSVDRLQNTMLPLFECYPRGIFKLTIRVVGRADDNRSVEATIQLQFQRGDTWETPAVIPL